MNTDPLHYEFEKALKHHQAGSLFEAAAGYQRVLDRDPNHVETLHLLGLLYHQAGNPEQALPLVDRAILHSGSAPELLSTRGMILRALGRPAESLAASTFPHTLGDFETDGFATPTGKVELYSETLAELGLDPLPAFAPPARAAADGFPLTLLTGIREKAYHHSRFRDQDWLRVRSPHPLLAIHPDTAAAQGVAAGDPVALSTPAAAGTCRLTVDVTEDVEPGVVATGMGWWLPEAQGPDFGARDVNINAALAYRGPCDPVTGSVDTRGLACRIERV